MAVVSTPIATRTEGDLVLVPLTQTQLRQLGLRRGTVPSQLHLTQTGNVIQLSADAPTLALPPVLTPTTRFQRRTDRATPRRRRDA